MDRKDVEILAQETVYNGYFQIDRYRLRHRRHEGGGPGKSRGRFSSAAMSRPSFLTTPTGMLSS